MLKKLRHIIAVFLLIIFPLSAIGMSINIHKCQHKGTIHFSFFYSSNNITKDCCNDSKKVKKCEMHKSESDCCSNKHSLNAACSVNTDKVNSKSSQQAVTRFSELTSACCSNSELTYQISFAYFASDYTKVQCGLFILTANDYDNFKTNINRDDFITINKIRYPLKEVIFSIISFIHSASDNSGNDSEVPKLHFC